MPDRIRSNREVIDGAIRRNAPGFRQIRLRQAVFIKANKPAEQQAIHSAVGSVVPIQQRVEASQRTDQSFCVNTSLLGLREEWDPL